MPKRRVSREVPRPRGLGAEMSLKVCLQTFLKPEALYPGCVDGQHSTSVVSQGCLGFRDCSPVENCSPQTGSTCFSGIVSGNLVFRGPAVPRIDLFPPLGPAGRGWCCVPRWRPRATVSVSRSPAPPGTAHWLAGRE